MRDDIAGGKEGIVILTLNAKPALSFLLLNTLFVLLLATGQSDVAYANSS